MASVGKCLLFYLKYPAEMDRLYWEDEPDVAGLPDADRNLDKIRLVGDAACRDAADLLEACVPGVEQHFRSISKVVDRIRRNAEHSWDFEFRVRTKPADRRFTIGTTLSEDRKALIPWVWCPGSRKAEEEVIRILGRGSTDITSALDWYRGSVALPAIPIPIPERWDDLVAREPLVAQVQQAFASFTRDEVKAIAAVANRRGEA
jgi:hypothetical protein